jgi:hypothetical protein
MSQIEELGPLLDRKVRITKDGKSFEGILNGPSLAFVVESPGVQSWFFANDGWKVEPLEAPKPARRRAAAGKG